MSEQDSRSNAEAAGDSAPSTPAAPTVAEPSPRSGGGGAGTVVLAVVLSLLVSGSAVLTSHKWAPGINRMLGTLDPVRALAAENQRLGAALAGLEERTTAATAQLAELSGVIKGDAAAAADLRSATMALAVGQLQAALRRPGSFKAELAVVGALGAGNADVEAAVAALSPFADGGVPSYAQIRAEFPQAAMAVALAAGDAGAKPAGGWYASMSTMLTQFGYLVRLDTPPADSAYATLQRARAHLAADDLAGATAEMAALPGPLDDTARAWLAAAKARVAADQAAAALAAAAVERLGVR